MDTLRFVTDLNKGILGRPDPVALWEEIIAKIPDEVFLKPMVKILCVAFGHGTEADVIARRMLRLGRTEAEVKNAIFMIDKYTPFVGQAKRKGYINVIKGDFLEWNTDMKFDVVVGNPPFQLRVGVNKTEPIWDRFVKRSFEITRPQGFVCMIHPSGWRSSKGRFGEVAALLKENNTEFLSLNSAAAGAATFGVGTDFDWYICNLSPSLGKTTVRDAAGVVEVINLTEWKFIPSAKLTEFSRLIAKPGEEKTNVLYSRSAYGTDKVHVSDTETPEFKFPCVYGIGKTKGVSYFFSRTDSNGHFGVPKVIWTGGSGSYPVIDSEGKFGLTQFAFAIAGDKSDLDGIARALTNPKLMELMSYCSKDMLNDKWSRKDLSELRADFWREFA